MAQPFEWDTGLFSVVTANFDRALHLLRHASACNTPSDIVALASRLKTQPGITRREFDRRFRLILSAVVQDDLVALQAIAALLRDTSPEALNAVRSLLPPQMRHLAKQPSASPQRSMGEPSELLPQGDAATSTGANASQESLEKFHAVALIGSADEHVRNEALLKSTNLKPLRQPTLDAFWDLAPTGICGFVIAGSAWRQIPAIEQRRAIRRICEYSTFLFVRVSIDGLDNSIAPRFTEIATEARCGLLDGQRFCHGLGCELSPADIQTLQSTAKFLDSAGIANFYPLGLSEHEASLLRLIAADRRHPDDPLTIYRLHTRELGGGSGARVFLLSDGRTQPFVAKIDDTERLNEELNNFRTWVDNCELATSAPTYHSHLGKSAISYRLQPAADKESEPAPTLGACLEHLRRAESYEEYSKVTETADDLFQAIARATDQLAALNSRRPFAGQNIRERFWLHWPIDGATRRGIDAKLLDHDWQNLCLSEVAEKAMSILKPNLSRGVVHGDVHGHNILVVDRIPVFIDFALSGPGHPLEDLVRLDAEVRSLAMRMLIDERSMQDVMAELYVDGLAADKVLGLHPELAASPVTRLAIRTAAKVRESALNVAGSHSMGLADLLAMVCVVSGHVLIMRNPGSGIERGLLAVVGAWLRDVEP